MLLFNLFPATSSVTGNLFKGLVEIASWKIVWAILGAMLTALSVASAYKMEGNYITLVVMNFVIAVSMLKTPSIVKSITSGGFHGMAKELGAAAATTMAAVPAKGAMVAKAGGAAKGWASGKVESYKAEKERQRSMYRY
jgi:hypothetical protein